MPRLVAFLRAINVGGHTVTMEELRRLFTSLGGKDVETFIASGNVIFNSRSRDIPALEHTIEQRLHAALGYEVATFVRTAGKSPRSRPISRSRNPRFGPREPTTSDFSPSD